MRTLTLILLLQLTACIDTGQEQISFPFSVAGTEHKDGFEGRNGWIITLQRADLAFGPLYLCAGTRAGELCENARGQWLQSVVVDALNAEAQPAGTIEAYSGTVRSWMYDLGFASLLTQEDSLELQAAKDLGGSSLRISGTAEQGATIIPFTGNLRLVRQEETEQGVSLVRSSSSDVFENTLSQSSELHIVFDASAWFASLDFANVAQSAGCIDSLCEEQDLAEHEQALRALSNDIVAGQRPSFQW
ncbi:MAG: hypothetical protein IPJ88_02440 [Myxococcales bacterium]|nr:MAG: hypothetical protein IPJ88_02440 [Myxococcales bacterium]